MTIRKKTLSLICKSARKQTPAIKGVAYGTKVVKNRDKITPKQVCLMLVMFGYPNNKNLPR